MSPPPLLDPPTMPTVVSRLPKFGSRSKHPTPPGVAAGTTRLTNGFYHHPGPAGGTRPPPSFKQNGFLRAPSSFSGRCRDNGGKSGNAALSRSGAHQHYPHQPQGAAMMSPRDARKPTFTGRGRGFGQAAPASQASSLSSSGPRSSWLRPPQTSTRPPSGGPALALGSGSAPGPAPVSGSGPGPGLGPGSRSGSPLHKKPPASRSSDSLGSAPSDQLTDNDRLRSRSLTHPCPSSLPRSRGLPGGGACGGAGGRVAPTLLPPSALKKPLLPGVGPASKPSGISYRLSRPSLRKQPRPLSGTSSDRRRNSIETPSTTENSPESSPEAPESDGLSAELVSQEELSTLGETLEDMSLSSTSSLDHNHTSQEYMDDFDNLGNGGVGLLLLSNQPEEDDSGLDQSCTRYDDDKAYLNGVTKATGVCFLDEGADWTGAERQLSHRRRRSSQLDDHDQGGSSLDLSPSDSCGSAGTYMWDEEGLEPLGGAVPPSASVHSTTTSNHMGSFDSDLNSIDLLNHLDSCDLAEDDLMLDGDVPEDASLHSEGGGLGLSHMAQWRRRQLCWETQDVQDEGDLHGDHMREEPGNKKSDDTELLLDLRSTHLTPPAPPGVDMEELAEDCSAVRSQLEHLHRFLLQEDDADDHTPSPDSIDSQVEALVQEVQQLREELRSRDRTIAQLTVQLTVPIVTTRCRCQETTGTMDRYTQTSVKERESVASQTPWRERTAPPPAPLLSPPWQYQRSSPYRGRLRPSIPPHLARKGVENLVLYFSDSACHRYFTPPIRTRNH